MTTVDFFNLEIRFFNSRNTSVYINWASLRILIFLFKISSFFSLSFIFVTASYVGFVPAMLQGLLSF